jgi:hypothetical protein
VSIQEEALSAYITTYETPPLQKEKIKGGKRRGVGDLELVVFAHLVEGNAHGAIAAYHEVHVFKLPADGWDNLAASLASQCLFEDI